MLVAPDKLVLVPSATYKTANHGKAFTAVQECCDQHCFARGATAKPVLGASDDTVVAIWFAGACSSARRLLAWKRWTLGPAAYRTGGENYSRGQWLRQGRDRDPLLSVKLR